MQYDLVRSGTTIRQLRIQNGYTQENLAKMLNIDRSFFSYIESGKRGCSVDRFAEPKSSNSQLYIVFLQTYRRRNLP